MKATDIMENNMELEQPLVVMDKNSKENEIWGRELDGLSLLNYSFYFFTKFFTKICNFILKLV